MSKEKFKMMLDLGKMNELNAEGCAACGGKFTLGETVVLACGAWDGPPKYVHENEAVYDTRTSTYVERRCYEAGRTT